MTKQKELLSQTITSLKGFFSAEDVYDEARKKDPKLGIATVYRFLKEQHESNQLYGYTCDRRKVYSRQQAHCHFRCQETGKVFHFAVDNIDFLKDKVPGTIESFQIEVTGVCDKCDH